MSSSRHAEHNTVWKSHSSWFLVRPPSRPASWQCSVIREWLLGLPAGGTVAILGSTPEFQDLLAEFTNLHAVVIDRSQEFHDHTSVQRQRLHRSDGRLQVEIGDWTEVLERHRSSFVAVLSDLTSGNIQYAERARFYSAVTECLIDGGLFIDRVLTREGNIQSRDQLYATYENCAVSIESINELNCKLLFTSDLHRGEELCVDRMLAQARAEWTSRAGRAFIDSLALVTPPTGRWWYGRPWANLRGQHGGDLTTIKIYPEPRGSAYEGHAQLLVKRRKESSMKVVPTRDRIQLARSRAIEVLGEAKVLLEHLPMPDEKLGEAFLDRIVEAAVSFRDACLVFKTERMEVGNRHWRFMEALFDRIIDRPPGRERTYSFCWRYHRSELLFSPEAAEWKSLFSKAIELAASDRIVVRAMMVTEDRKAPRMAALEQLARKLGDTFQIAFIRPQDFEATKDSDGLKQYLDFGIFGTSVGFLTAAYEPMVRGDYVWAIERVIGLHDLFDRIWDQAVKPSVGRRACESPIDWHVAFGALEQEDRDTPVSCVAEVAEVGGGRVLLNDEDLRDAWKACAEWCNRVEKELRACIQVALEVRVGTELGTAKLAEFIGRANKPGSPRPRVARDAGEATTSIQIMLDSMYFLQKVEFVQANWRVLVNCGKGKEIMPDILRLNTRPHAHAKTIDLADLVVYRDAAMRVRKWIKAWRMRLEEQQAEGGIQ